MHTRIVPRLWLCRRPRRLEDSKSTSGGILCIFWSRTFVPISWMCKKRTSVSHCSTEAEVISLDAGLRMDGLLALDLLDLVIEVFHSSPNQTNKTKDVRQQRWNQSASPQQNMRKQIPNNAHQSRSDQHWSRSIKRDTFWFPMLCCMSLRIMNEAVSKMIIKSRSPTMRHLSRTNRVALDWLFWQD